MEDFGDFKEGLIDVHVLLGADLDSQTDYLVKRVNFGFFECVQGIGLDLSFAIRLVADHKYLGVGLVVILSLWQPVFLEALSEGEPTSKVS